jgi:hypothetical protein
MDHEQEGRHGADPHKNTTQNTIPVDQESKRQEQSESREMNEHPCDSVTITQDKQAQAHECGQKQPDWMYQRYRIVIPRDPYSKNKYRKPPEKVLQIPMHDGLHTRDHHEQTLNGKDADRRYKNKSIASVTME